MKTCTAAGCVNPVFGKGFCIRHQWMRKDKKPKKPKKMPVQATRKPMDELSFGFEDQTALFESLWERAKNKSGRVFCKYTGEELTNLYGTDVWYWCFAHVLPKGRYTYFKLNPDNVRVVFPSFHMIIDQGTIEDRAKYPGWKFYLWEQDVFRMKEEYEKFKKEHLLR